MAPAHNTNAAIGYLVAISGLPETAIRFALLAWQQLPIRVGGREVGTLLHREGEIHVAFDADYRRRAFPRSEAMRLLGPLLATYGRLTTRIPHGEAFDYARRYVTRLGFAADYHDNTETHYTLDRIPYERTAR